ncbi:hypothetical protein [Leptolyngbya sp. PCC 6406]|uniref:hypothetical protein n=1 Tax=Leptolyngbya sp. PCC 6406 TaxID=1173264 RepID=UPI0002ABEF40|nr:hypothetical protein [Leptolyngbya sp. PCC 6406]
MTGFEPLIGAAAAGLGGLITSLVKDKGSETLNRLDWDIGKNLTLKKAMVGYVRRYIDRHRICFGWSEQGATEVEIVDYH